VLFPFVEKMMSKKSAKKMKKTDPNVKKSISNFGEIADNDTVDDLENGAKTLSKKSAKKKNKIDPNAKKPTSNVGEISDKDIVDGLVEEAKELSQTIDSNSNKLHIIYCQLVRKKAWEVLNIKKTQLVKHISCDEFCLDYQYSMLHTATIEEELGLEIGSLKIQFGKELKKVKKPKYRQKAWDFACEEAKGEEYVKKKHIEEGVAMALEQMQQDSEEGLNKQVKIKKPVAKVESYSYENVVSAYKRLKSIFKKGEKDLIVNILTGSEEYRNLLMTLCSDYMTADDRKKLITLINVEQE